MEAHEMAILKTNKMFEMLTRQRDDALNFIVNQSGRIAELEMNIQELQEKYNAATETIARIQEEKIKGMIPEDRVSMDTVKGDLQDQEVVPLLRNSGT